MTHFSRPMAGLIGVAIAMVIIGNLVSPAVPAGTPPPADHPEGPGCYCHNDGVGLWVNGTDWDSGDVFDVDVESGKSFSFLIVTRNVDTVGILPGVVTWMPNMADNGKFKFDPQEVRDGSPQDPAPGDGIDALFKIAAPDKPGKYALSASAEGRIVSLFVKVKDASGASLSGSASIVNVESPSVAEAGRSVGVKVAVQNTGSVARKLYMYVTDRTTGAEILPKVYSDEPVPGNGTVTLSGAFEMPNETLTLTVHGGYVQDEVDADDALFGVSILLALPEPPIRTVPLGVLVRQWVPWIAIIAVSLGSVQVFGSYATKRKSLFSRPERLRMAVVEGGPCGVCRAALANLGRDTLSLLSRDVVLEPVMTGAIGEEPLDVAFVVGSVRTEEDLDAAKKARDKARFLVAYGGCAVFGLLPVGEAGTSRISTPTSTNGSSKLLSEIRPLSDYVKVDLTIPGCPPPHSTINSAIETILDRFDARERKKK